MWKKNILFFERNNISHNFSTQFNLSKKVVLYIINKWEIEFQNPDRVALHMLIIFQEMVC